MTPTEAQPTLFEDLAADLPGPHKAEFFQNLHQVGIGPNDVELARLLRSLQLYKAYYESIPAAVREAASEIERLTADAPQLGSLRPYGRAGRSGSGALPPGPGADPRAR